MARNLWAGAGVQSALGSIRSISASGIAGLRDTNAIKGVKHLRNLMNTITTAERAAMMCKEHGKLKFSSSTMVAFIGHIRADKPELRGYLDHPEIVTGLALGRFGVGGLIRRLEELEEDNADLCGLLKPTSLIHK